MQHYCMTLNPPRPSLNCNKLHPYALCYSHVLNVIAGKETNAGMCIPKKFALSITMQCAVLARLAYAY